MLNAGYACFPLAKNRWICSQESKPAVPGGFLQGNKQVLIIVLRPFQFNSAGRSVTLELCKQGITVCSVILMSKYISEE